jgi:hypothetical protein
MDLQWQAIQDRIQDDLSSRLVDQLTMDGEAGENGSGVEETYTTPPASLGPEDESAFAEL